MVSLSLHVYHTFKGKESTSCSFAFLSFAFFPQRMETNGSTNCNHRCAFKLSPAFQITYITTLKLNHHLPCMPIFRCVQCHRLLNCLHNAVCACACVCVCGMHMCMHLCIICLHECMHVCMYVCMYACMHAYMHECAYVYRQMD